MVLPSLSSTSWGLRISTVPVAGVSMDDDTAPRWGGAADMEGAHSELGSRLADRLGRDHTDGLADIDRRAPRKVAAVAARADSHRALAGEHGANADLFDARCPDRFHVMLLDHRARLDHDLVGHRIDNVGEREAAEHALGKRDDLLGSLDDRLHVDAFRRAAVLGDDDTVLSDIDKAPCQVSGIGSLERRVGQALAGAMGRVEVLADRQASLKLAMIGVSMISPDGFAMSPRMPASCLICAGAPRAPEWAIM